MFDLTQETWTTLAAIAAALAAVFTWAWQARRARANDLEIRVSREVDAKLGTFLRDIVALRDQVTAHLTQARSDVAASEQAPGIAVTRAEAMTSTIEELLERAGRALPTVEAVEAVPAILNLQAVQELRKGERATATLLLAKVLDSAEAASADLERAGDIAREELGNDPLSLKLYKRAIEVDPDNISAMAEYLCRLASSPRERGTARTQLVELALQNPNHRTVVERLLDFLNVRNDYVGMKEVAFQLLEKSTLKANLHRNIAIANHYLGAPSDEVRRSYEEAIHYARTEGDDTFVNVARPYLAYLIRSVTDFDHAEKILNQALTFNPGEATLHFQRGELRQRQGRLAEAEASFFLVTELGDPQEAAIARSRLQNLGILKLLNLSGTSIPGESNGSPLVSAEAGDHAEPP